VFLVYINELAAILDCYGIKIKLFADDAKLYVQIVNELNVVQLYSRLLTRWLDGLLIGSYLFQSISAVY